MLFTKLCKNRGFYETILILYKEKNYRLKFHLFSIELEEIGSYYNAFFRVRKDLEKYGVIKFTKNRNKRKIIILTEKGVQIAKKLKQIQSIFDLEWDKYQEEQKMKEKIAKKRAKTIAKKRKIQENDQK